MTPEQCRIARKKLKWSIDKLATQAGMATQTVGNYERRKTGTSEQTIMSIRRAFLRAGVEVDEL
ncbi:helix-turn-helix transcriptional regulator [Azospirillum sp. SYSU D00513]|uniref:helix-turn-helix domain-containing protein n=1 Tax=Azospirillum sp. SYSU D00513 TaxID=2812561 RepID=UPI001A96469D|nr:helix-turn-helix transcriptional regulator [Azospirillum sp. SYSU D00513]